MRTRRCSQLRSSAELRHRYHAREAVPAGAVPDAAELSEQRRPVRVVVEECLQTGVQHLVPFAGGGGRKMRAADRAGARKPGLEPAPEAARLRLAAELVQRNQHPAEI